MLLDAILSALVPVAIDGIKQTIAKFTGGVRPTSVAEQIQLDQNEIQKLQALAALDNPGGTPSQWVIDLRGSARYIGSLLVIAVGVCSIYTEVDDSVKTIGLEAANIAFGFLFGSRIMANLQVKR